MIKQKIPKVTLIFLLGVIQFTIFIPFELNEDFDAISRDKILPSVKGADNTLTLTIHDESRSWNNSEFDALDITYIHQYLSHDGIEYCYNGKNGSFSGTQLPDLIASTIDSTDFTQLEFIQRNGTITRAYIGDMLGMADTPLIASKINGTSLFDHNDTYLGNFIYLNIGNEPEFIPDIVEIRAVNYWLVTVTVDDKPEIYVSLQNLTDFGEIRTVHHAYYDYESGYGFNETVKGIYIRDILAHSSISSQNYEIKLACADGWTGSNIWYSKNDVENGIQSPQEIMNENDQYQNLPVDCPPILCFARAENEGVPENNTILNGAFHAIIPGVSKHEFSKFVVTIRVKTLEDEDNAIPGYQIMFITIGCFIAIVQIIHKKKKLIYQD